MSARPLALVKGEDPVLRSDVVARLVDELLAGADRSLALDDIEIEDRKRDDEDDDRDDERDEVLGADLSLVERILVALASPPFLTERRVVVIRNVGGLTKGQAELVAAQLVEPVPGVHAVLVNHGGKLPTAIDKVVKAHKVTPLVPEAEEIAASTAKKKGSDKRSVVEVELQRMLGETGVKLESAARATIVRHLGDDAARVRELVALLATRFPVGSTIRADELEPYLGDAGTVTNAFELTTAIEQGDTATALDVLHRLLHSTSAKHAKVQHPIMLMGVLTSYYRSLLRIDSPSVVTKNDAHAILGGNEWAAKYRLDALRTIGSAGLRRAYELLAQADLDLRGAGGTRAIDDETVMVVLVARLCGLHQRSGSRGSASAPAARGRGR